MPWFQAKRIVRWQLRTLLILVAIVAALLATWTHWIVPYNDQLAAKNRLGPLTQEMQSVLATPHLLAKFDPERFSEIVQLRGRSGEIDSESIAPIADMPFLRRVYLNRTSVGDQGLRYIGQLKQLERLSLWGSKVGDDGLASLSGCHNLVALDLHETCVSDQGLEKLLALPNLGELILGKGVQGSGLQYVARMPNLWRLDLSRSGIRYDKLDRLASCGVSELKLPREIPARVCTALASLPNLTRCDSRIVRADDSTAEVISQCRRLEQVDLAGVGITDAATATVAKMQSLQDLSMHGDLTDKSLAIVAKASQLKSVRLKGRFSIAAIASLAAQRRDLELTIFTHIPAANRSNEFDRFPHLSVVSLMTRDHAPNNDVRISVNWPAQTADLNLWPMEVVEKIESIRLVNPPALRAAYPSTYQLEWSLDGTEHLSNLKEIGCPRLGPGELSRIGSFDRLTSLLLEDDLLTDGELHSLELPKTFRRLIIIPSRVSRQGLSSLKERYPNIEMRENGMGTIYENRRWQFPWVGQGSIDDMVAFPQLEAIQMEYVRSTLEINQLATLPKLRSISFRGSIRHAPIWTLDQDLPQLESFSCTMNSFNDAQFAELRRMRNLKQLLLHDVTITDAGFSVLEELPQLEEVNIQGHLFNGSGFRYFSQCKNLKKINLRAPSLDGQHFEHLVPLQELQELRLAYNWVGDEACKHLAKLPSLQWLELTRAKITDEGLQSLGESKSLHTLFIGSNQVTAVGLRAVARCKSLRTVYLQNNPGISPDDRQRIEAEFRHVQIVE